MKNVLIGIAVTLGVLITIVSLLVFVNYLFPEDRASAEIVERIEEIDNERELSDDVPLRSVSASLPDDGIVGDNIVIPLANTTYTRYSASSPLDSWYLGNQTVYNYGQNGSSVVTSSTWGGLDYPFYSTTLTNVTLTVCAYSPTSSISYGVRGYRNGSSSATVIASKSISSRNDYTVSSLNVTLDSSLYQRYFIFIWSASSGTFYIKWCKLETGDNFTGFVPNDYQVNGYNEGYEQGQIDEQNSINNLYDGWSRAVNMVDLKSTDFWYQEGKITSPNGGMISYVQNQGVQLTSTQDGTIFRIAGDGLYAVYPGNFIYIFALGYSGSFSLGDVVISRSVGFHTNIDYTNVRADLETYVYSAQLDTTGLFISQPITGSSAGGEISLTLKAGVSLIVSAYKTELGTTFTRFYQNNNMSNSQWQSGFSEGYSTGTIAGREEGYSIGADAGYEQAVQELYDTVYQEGYAAGVEYFASIAEHGDWWDVLSALINIPITFIMSLVSFEVLGLNFGSILRTIILLSLFFYVARKLL